MWTRALIIPSSPPRPSKHRETFLPRKINKKKSTLAKESWGEKHTRYPLTFSPFCRYHIHHRVQNKKEITTTKSLKPLSSALPNPSSMVLHVFPPKPYPFSPAEKNSAMNQCDCTSRETSRRVRTNKWWDSAPAPEPPQQQQRPRRGRVTRAPGQVTQEPEAPAVARAGDWAAAGGETAEEGKRAAESVSAAQLLR